MGVASLVIGIVALLLGMMGFIPAIGVVSLLAPVLSLFGCVLGGVGISRAKQEGVGSGLAVGGLVVNIVALLITLPIALTCGACNACLATGAIMGGSDGGVRWQRTDGGAYIWQGGSDPPTYAPGYPAPTPPPTPMMPMQPPPPGAPAPVFPPAPPGAPAPAFPPPPMPAPGAPPPTDPTFAPPPQAPIPSPMPPPTGL